TGLNRLLPSFSRDFQCINFRESWFFLAVHRRARLLEVLKKARVEVNGTLTYNPLPSSLKRGSRDHSYLGKIPRIRNGGLEIGSVSEVMKASYCVLRHIGGTLCGLSV